MILLAGGWGAGTAQASLVTATMTGSSADLGGGLYRYDFTLLNTDGPDNVWWFYTSTSITPDVPYYAAPNGDWTRWWYDGNQVSMWSDTYFSGSGSQAYTIGPGGASTTGTWSFTTTELRGDWTVYVNDTSQNDLGSMPNGLPFGDTTQFDVQTGAIPEPSSLALVGFGMGLLAMRRRAKAEHTSQQWQRRQPPSGPGGCLRLCRPIGQSQRSHMHLLHGPRDDRGPRNLRKALRA